MLSASVMRASILFGLAILINIALRPTSTMLAILSLMQMLRNFTTTIYRKRTGGRSASRVKTFRSRASKRDLFSAVMTAERNGNTKAKRSS